jgi:hypothetical protein
MFGRLRSFTELVLRLFAESTLSRIRSFALLRMTGSEGLKNDMRRAGSDSRRIQDDRLYPKIHNRVTYSANL